MKARTEKMTTAELKRAEKTHREVINEGGYGYNPYTEPLMARLAEEKKAKFAAIWTADVARKRRETWNKTIRSMAENGKIAHQDLTRLTKQLGWTSIDLRNAIAMHNL